MSQQNDQGSGKRPGQGPGTLAIFGVAILLNLLLTVMVLDQVDRTRDEVGALSTQLVTKQDLAMFRPLRVREILETRCTRCHTARRFAETMAMEPSEIHVTVARMSAHSGGEIEAGEWPQIEAALLLNRCTACHNESVISRILLKPYDERLRFLRQKVRMPNSGFRTDQVSDIADAIRILNGA